MEEFTFPQWKGCRMEIVEEEEEVKEDTRQAPVTPIAKQPACFRVGTPFPLDDSEGGVKVVGKNATEIGFSFPSFRSGGKWLAAHGNEVLGGSQRATGLRKEQDLDLDKGLSVRDGDAVVDVEGSRMLVDSEDAGLHACSSLSPQPASERGSLMQKALVDSLIGDRIPCRESLARLSLDDDSVDVQRGENGLQNTLKASNVGDACDHTADLIDLAKTTRQRDKELSEAREEIKRLKDLIYTLEFKRKEYVFDDGHLGMAAFLKSFEERLDCDSVHLKGLLTEEIKKRKAYQNGYYEAVAKNADLVEQLEKTRQSEAQKQCKDANAMLPENPLKLAGPRRRVTVKNGISKKVRMHSRRSSTTTR